MGQPWFRIWRPPRVAVGLAALCLASWAPETVKNAVQINVFGWFGKQRWWFGFVQKILWLFRFHFSSQSESCSPLEISWYIISVFVYFWTNQISLIYLPFSFSANQTPVGLFQPFYRPRATGIGQNKSGWPIGPIVCPVWKQTWQLYQYELLIMKRVYWLQSSFHTVIHICRFITRVFRLDIRYLVAVLCAYNYLDLCLCG